MKPVHSLLIALGALSFGCGGSQQEADDAQSVQSGAYGTADVETSPPSDVSETSAQTDDSTQVTVEASLAQQCGLSSAKLYFPYDSDSLKGNTDEHVKSMADCLTSGNLKGRELELIGHTDPRGTDEYNKTLGRSRAETIASLLASAGMPQDKIVVRSEGEQGASDDKEDWPQERRVDISLINN